MTSIGTAGRSVFWRIYALRTPKLAISDVASLRALNV